MSVKCATINFLKKNCLEKTVDYIEILCYNIGKYMEVRKVAINLSPKGMGKRGSPLIPGGESLSLLSLRKYDIGLVKREYTRVRDIARKRIARLNKSGLITPRQYKNMQAQIPKIGSMKGNDVYTALMGVYRFLSSPGSTVSGVRKQRKTSLQNLQLMGIDFANESNVDIIFRFIDDQSARTIDGKVIGSPTAIRFLAEERPMSLVLEDLEREFEKYLSDPENIF